MFFKPVRFTWSEPRRARVQLSISTLQRYWKLVLLLAAVLTGFLWIAAFSHLARRGLPMHFSGEFLLVSAACTVGLVVLIAGPTLLPSSVRVYDDELVLDSSRTTSLPFSSISYCELTREGVSGRQFPVFSVHTKKSSRVTTVLWDPRRPISELHEILQFGQVEFRNRL